MHQKPVGVIKKNNEINRKRVHPFGSSQGAHSKCGNFVRPQNETYIYPTPSAFVYTRVGMQKNPKKNPIRGN